MEIEKLIERLRAKQDDPALWYDGGYRHQTLVNPDGPVAADLLQQLAIPSDAAVEAVARVICGGDPDRLVQAGNLIGEPADYPAWMFSMSYARAAILAFAAHLGAGS